MCFVVELLLMLLICCVCRLLLGLAGLLRVRSHVHDTYCIALHHLQHWAQPDRGLSLRFSQGHMVRSSRRWTRVASAPPSERPAQPIDKDGGYSAYSILEDILRHALHDAIEAIDHFLTCLKPDLAGQHVEACTSLDQLKTYVTHGPDYLLQAACWLSKLCLAMPAKDASSVQELCWGIQLRNCMRCTQDFIGLGMILDKGMASSILDLPAHLLDLNTRSRIIGAHAKQLRLLGQLGDQLIKMARPTLDQLAAACPGMGGAASSSMEMEPRYAWLSSAAGPAPAP